MRRFLVLVALAVLLAGCGGSANHQTTAKQRTIARAVVLPGPPKPSTAPLDPLRMRPLPAQGIVIRRKHDLLLVGLDGKPYGRLVGFDLTSYDPTAFDSQMIALAEATRNALLITGPRHRWYRFGGSPPRLTELVKPRLALPGGSELRARSWDVKDTLHESWSIIRDGRTIARAAYYHSPATLQVLPGGELVQLGDDYAGGSVLSLISGDTWKFPKGCVPVNVRADELLMICTRQARNLRNRATVVYLSRDGSERRLPSFPIGGYLIDEGWLSPDGRTVLAHTQPPCGVGDTLFISSVSGVPKGISIPDRRFSSSLPFFSSEPIGWSADGKAVISTLMTASDCPEGGIERTYLVDPKTLEPRLVNPRAFYPMWNPAAPSTRP